ncbi:MAG: transcription antitermination factor NusB [Dysgonamonadaceae bacterium]|jgi:N utilization substance protein B|nr:transcription antitermination factor NusB [Dysgonamonadaceae bacterium]
MINRTVIRSKVLQVLFSTCQKEDKDLKIAENELLFSLQKSYDLYHYLLLIIPHLTDMEQKRLDLRKHKHLATEADLNPNTRFINNRLSALLSTNEYLQSFASQKGLFWTEDTNFTKKLLNQIIGSEQYAAYLQSPDDYASDKEFWKQSFKKFIYNNEELDELLEDKCIYWNDDVEIIETFVLKTIKKLEETAGDKQELLPMFKDEEDRTFAIKLLRESFLQNENVSQRIDKHIENWDFDRIANMDLYIMQMAICELLSFPHIPINVTLNEYIDLAKIFSTPKSATFINGVLDAIVEELKSENLLFKS